jgi:hypothetical protein
MFILTPQFAKEYSAPPQQFTKHTYKQRHKTYSLDISNMHTNIPIHQISTIIQPPLKNNTTPHHLVKGITDITNTTL